MLCQCCQSRQVELSFPYGFSMYHVCKKCFMQLKSMIQVGLDIEKQEAQRNERWMEAAYIGKSAKVNR